MLTEKQRIFCDTKLKTVLNRSTGIRGLYYDNFTGFFSVRDQEGDYIDSFTDITEAIECLLCAVHGFRSVDPATVHDVIAYMDAEKFAR
jgi:hypothetical protein